MTHENNKFQDFFVRQTQGGQLEVAFPQGISEGTQVMIMQKPQKPVSKWQNVQVNGILDCIIASSQHKEVGKPHSR